MKKIVTIHQTDLYRPHIDPDDHYDLACQFALAKRGYLDLRMILIDYPPKPNHQPDTLAVNQLNQITHLSVDVAVGGKKDETNSDLIISLRDTLIQSEDKVVIHIVGSCFDMALFYRLYPKLFIEKVEALYINAGSAFYSNLQEYNQFLNNESFLSLFSIPVNIYWFPCFHDMDKIWEIGEHGSFYKLKQKDIFDHLNEPLLNYFLSCLRQDPLTSKIQDSLNMDINPSDVDKFGSLFRNMWCTAGFIHSVGLNVDLKGRITNDMDHPLFSFEDIQVSIKQDHLYWMYSKSSSNIKMLKIHDIGLYQENMTKALNTMIGWLK